MSTRKDLHVALAAAAAAVLAVGLLLPLAGVRSSQAERPRLQESKLATTALGSAFTYQARLTDASGSPFNGTCDLSFRLYDSASGGTQVGALRATSGGADTRTDQVVPAVTVSQGHFSVDVDFGADAFTGDARWLEIAIKCQGDAEYTAMPRQAVRPVPYALALPGLRTCQNATSPSIIGGFRDNAIPSGVAGATVAGGGADGSTNRVTDNYGVVAGGYDNLAGDDTGSHSDRPCAAVGGGKGNTASGAYAAVAGGEFNEASGGHSAVAGGTSNTASAWAATVGGGYANVVSGDVATIGGGHGNRVTDNHSTVSGGRDNQAGDDAGTTFDADYATVAGGRYNTAGADFTFVGGGANNTAEQNGATVSGGAINTASGGWASVAGGWSNVASGDYATVAGGSWNSAEGDYSFAAGHHASANHHGAFVWADSNATDYDSSAENEFRVRASGGIYLHSNATATTGVTLPPGGTSWAFASDRALKENLALVDPQDLLERLSSLPVYTWTLPSQQPSIRHIGPVAQDFHAALGYGEDERHINSQDAHGVALAAIQALRQLSEEQAARIEVLEDENLALKRRLDVLEALTGVLDH